VFLTKWFCEMFRGTHFAILRNKRGSSLVSLFRKMAGYGRNVFRETAKQHHYFAKQGPGAIEEGKNRREDWEP
jgi:hypothetical protein